MAQNVGNLRSVVFSVPVVPSSHPFDTLALLHSLNTQLLYIRGELFANRQERAKDREDMSKIREEISKVREEVSNIRKGILGNGERLPAVDI